MTEATQHIAFEPAVADVLRELVRGGPERFALPEGKQLELTRRIERHLEDDLRLRRTEGLFALVRLAKVLEQQFESTRAAATLRSILRASLAGRALFSFVESKSQVFQDACEKYAGTERTLPASAAGVAPSVAPRAAGPRSDKAWTGASNPAAQAIRAAFLMTPGELEARRVKPSFSVRRLSNQARELAANPPPDVRVEEPREHAGRAIRGRRRVVAGG
ncbi:MAG: hypothetical protein IPK13_16205 [Deltaproteobacteria bacterium]|nr:hypothetical protein [Deltaproteobacteria bacterium]